MSVFAALESAWETRTRARGAVAEAAAAYVQALDAEDAVDVELGLRRLRLLVDAMAVAERAVDECHAAIAAAGMPRSVGDG